MKNIGNITISIFTVLGFFVIISAFTNQHEPKNIYEFETITGVESLIKMV